MFDETIKYPPGPDRPGPEVRAMVTDAKESSLVKKNKRRSFFISKPILMVVKVSLRGVGGRPTTRWRLTTDQCEIQLGWWLLAYDESQHQHFVRWPHVSFPSRSFLDNRLKLLGLYNSFSRLVSEPTFNSGSPIVHRFLCLTTWCAIFGSIWIRVCCPGELGGILHRHITLMRS